MPAWADSPDDLVKAWSKFTPASPDPATLLGQVQQAIHLTVKARADLRTDLASDTVGDRSERRPRRAPGRATTGGARRSPTRSAWPRSWWRRPHPPRVIYVSGLGDYDTHQGQAQRHPSLMADLDEGIEAFFTTLDQSQAE